MSREHGPLWRFSRALSFPLLGGKEFSRGKKRTTRPGIHGYKRKRMSPYAVKLQEKQKIKYGYGWRDRQLKLKYLEAQAKQGDTGINLLVISESRLDSVVFRSGLFNTRRSARQWVNHGFFLVGNKEVSIPSYQVKPGQEIRFRKEKMEKVSKNKLIKSNLEQNVKVPGYLQNSEKDVSDYLQKLTITYLRPPTLEDLSKNVRKIDTQLVVEWYSQKV